MPERWKHLSSRASARMSQRAVPGGCILPSVLNRVEWHAHARGAAPGMTFGEEFKDKVALVAGGTGALGRQVTTAFLGVGARVVVT